LLPRTIVIRPARDDQLEHVASILEEAARWLFSRGVNQWPATVGRARIAAQTDSRDFYLAWDGAQAVGTFSLQTADVEMWGEQPDEALYLHSLAVRRSHRGLGRQLLSWAEQEAEGRGKRYLRLDCDAASPALRSYYERAGYAYRRDVPGAGWTVSLYEKPVALSRSG
jgi:GNAT superfamily N-acetyltransferase